MSSDIHSASDSKASHIVEFTAHELGLPDAVQRAATAVRELYAGTPVTAVAVAANLGINRRNAFINLRNAEYRELVRSAGHRGGWQPQG